MTNRIVSAGWENVGQVPSGEKPTFKVENLTPKKQYKFRIRAVNKLGSSEPAQFSKPILAKDPWGMSFLQVMQVTSVKIIFWYF